MAPMKLVFLGSPDFAVPSLQRMAAVAQIACVVTQPDRPAGRGRRPQPSPIKREAQALHLPVLQPERIADEAVTDRLLAFKPDVVIVVAFGQILRPPLLDAPPFGCVNVHASLLPRWRGASPIQHALLAGDAQTGITLIRMDAGIDTGPILAQRPHPIREDHTAGTLGGELAIQGADLLADCLPRYLAGEIRLVPQPADGVTYAPRLKRSDGLLDPNRPAVELARRVRALDPWPGTRLAWEDGLLAVRKAQAAAGSAAAPGSIIPADGHPALVTASGSLVLELVQPPGGRPMPGSAYLAGHPEFLQVHIEPPDPSPGSA